MGNRTLHNKTLNEITKRVMDRKNIYTIDELSFDTGVRMACESLASGAVIALPTDTVYGLACDANNPNAIRKLYDIKGRNQKKPVAICVANLQALKIYGDSRHLNDRLLEDLLPGPLTIIVKRTEYLTNPYLNEGISKIGIRIPDARFIQELCCRYEQPLALTSANLSSVESSLCVEEFQELWPFLGQIFDGGRINYTYRHRDDEQRNGSTIVDLSKSGYYKIVRMGIAVKRTLQILHKYGIKKIS